MRTEGKRISMQDAVIISISAIVGALVSGLFSLISAKSSSDTNAESAYQDNLFKRVISLEDRQDKLEHENTLWRMRYFALYRWVIRISKNMNIKLPEYHKMQFEELQQKIKKDNEENNKLD